MITFKQFVGESYSDVTNNGNYIPNPNGRKEMICNLRKFCRDNIEYRLNYKSLSRVANNKQSHHRGFTCKLVNNL
jgi:hypothetical protein